MPRKRRVITEEVLPDINENISANPELDSPLNDEDEALQQVIAEFGPEPVKTKVHKITSKGSEFCFVSHEPIDEDIIRSRYGGGTYVLSYYVSSQTAAKKRIKINIAEPVVPIPQLVNNGSNAIADLQVQMLKAQLENQARLMELLITNGRANGPNTSLTELTSAMQTVHAMNSNSNNGMEMFKTALDLAKELVGKSTGGDWKTDLIETVKEVGKPLAAAYFMNNQNSSNKSETQSLPVNDISNMIKHGLAWIKPKILANRISPEMATDLLLMQADNPQYYPFIQLALQADFQSLVQIDNELANEPYNTFFRKVLDEIRQTYSTTTTDSYDDTTIAGESGNSGNVNDNAPTNVRSINTR